MYPPSLENLIESFKYLPGIGEKTAERLAFATMDMSEERKEMFINSIQDVQTHIHLCPICNSLTEEEICNICNSQIRDDAILCVVEDPRSVFY